jgi:KDO2-lipid IV(A) lauroyltransferase
VRGLTRRVWVTARDLALAVPVLVLALPLWALPWSLAARLGRAYGRCAWSIWPQARRVALINLRRALGLDRRAARELGRAGVANLGAALADGLQCARRRSRDLERHVRFEDPDLAASLLADPRPKVFVMAHLGSWEMTAAILARRFGDRGSAIGRRLDNRFLDLLVRRLRVARPGQWLEKRGGTGAALARLRAGDHVALLLDEDAGRRGAFVEFFGRPASTQRSAALLTLMSGAQLVAGAVVRAPGGERLFLLAEIDADSARVDELTGRVTAVLEQWIRRYPEQWRWIHWRWRQRPDGSRETYTRHDLDGVFLLR